MNINEFQNLLGPVIGYLSSQKIESSLAEKLEQQFSPDGELFNSIEAACHTAISDGWMCSQGAQGRRFGRIIEPSEDTAMFSVDVVDLENIVGPHHLHPKGEVCMVMPVTNGAQFDGNDRGWCVYEPDSSHCPTVTNGEALVLYMLPDGEIKFTEQ